MTVIVVNEQERQKVQKVYDTAASVVQIGAVASITRSGNTATVTRPNHSYTSGQSVTISGADQAEYNGTFTITVVDPDTFTFDVLTLPTSPATGTITADAVTVTSVTRTGNVATVTLTDHGYSTNDSVVIAGANETAYNGTFTVTVTGANTFTYVIQAYPATPATGTLYSSMAEQSLWVNAPKAIQIESIAAATTVKMEVAISLALGWQQFGSDLSNADDGKIFPLDASYNFVRLRRSAGTGAIKAHVQY